MMTGKWQPLIPWMCKFNCFSFLNRHNQLLKANPISEPTSKSQSILSLNNNTAQPLSTLCTVKTISMALSFHSHSIFLTTTQSQTSSNPNFLSFHHQHAPTTTFHYFPASKPTTHKLSAPTDTEKWRAKVSFFPAFLNKRKDAKTLKEELLEAIAPLDRGADATAEDQQVVDQIARNLEKVSPIKETLKSNLLNGKWELLYTTSSSILQTQRPKFLRSSANYQAINLDTLRAQNMESWPFFNQVTADLTPLNARKVAVKFDYFKIAGLIPVKAPDSARGELEITYLDEEMRVARGDKGNLFILKMVDPSYQVPA